MCARNLAEKVRKVEWIFLGVVREVDVKRNGVNQ